MLTVVVFLCAFVILLILWMLLVPVMIYLDTATNRYEIKQWGLFSARVVPGTLPLLHVRVLGFRLRLNPQPEQQQARPSKPKKEGKSFSRPAAAWIKLMARVRKSFQIRKIHINLDTGDPVTNAKLYALIWLMPAQGNWLTINFNGTVYMQVVARLNVYVVAWAFIQFLLNI